MPMQPSPTRGIWGPSCPSRRVFMFVTPSASSCTRYAGASGRSSAALFRAGGVTLLPMHTLVTGAGWSCLVGAGLWLLGAAYQNGFLFDAFWAMFLEDKYDRSSSRSLFRDHWHDVKGPFVLLLAGVALLLIGARG